MSARSSSVASHQVAITRRGTTRACPGLTGKPSAMTNAERFAAIHCEAGTSYYARPGITYRPVTGVSPSQVGVAWSPANDTNPVVQDFVRCCLDNKPPA